MNMWLKTYNEKTNNTEKMTLIQPTHVWERMLIQIIVSSVLADYRVLEHVASLVFVAVQKELLLLSAGRYCKPVEPAPNVKLLLFAPLLLQVGKLQCPPCHATLQLTNHFL